MALIAVLVFITATVITANKYSKAITLFENGQYAEAENLFASIKYKDSASKAEEAKLIGDCLSSDVGDIISINQLNWIILKKENNKILAIAEAPAATKSYNNNYGDGTWENCNLRKYLNGEYYDTFSEAAKKHIAETEIENPPNLVCESKGGNATKDKIFLLSLDEAETLMTAEQREFPDWWWLRSPGSHKLRMSAAKVNGNGDIIYAGNYVINDNGLVRPAMWLSFDE